MNDPRVLLIEDCDFIQTHLCRQLMRSGFDVDVVADADSALTKSSQMNYDFVYIRLGLPKMNGFKVASQIEKLGHKHGRVVIFTDTPMRYLIKGSLRYGLRDCEVFCSRSPQLSLKHIKDHFIIDPLLPEKNHLKQAKKLTGISKQYYRQNEHRRKNGFKNSFRRYLIFRGVNFTFTLKARFSRVKFSVLHNDYLKKATAHFF